MTDVLGEVENGVLTKVAEVDAESSDSEDLKKEATIDNEDTVNPKALTYREQAKARGMNYTVTDVPPLGTAMLLGTQHYLTMLGGTVLIPLIICPAMGGDGNQTAEVISSIFFVSGINTLLQTTIGDRCVLFMLTKLTSRCFVGFDLICVIFLLFLCQFANCPRRLLCLLARHVCHYRPPRFASHRGSKRSL